MTPVARARSTVAANQAKALSILEQALRTEERRGFDDGAVKGGLDRLLERLYGERRLPPGDPITRAVGDLAQTSYRSLPPAGRAHWIQTLTNLLQRNRADAARDGKPLQGCALAFRHGHDRACQRGGVHCTTVARRMCSPR